MQIDMRGATRLRIAVRVGQALAFFVSLVALAPLAHAESANCTWSGTYSDNEKTITRHGTATLSLSGDKLTLSSPPPIVDNETWRVGRWHSKVYDGGTSYYTRMGSGSGFAGTWVDDGDKFRIFTADASGSGSIRYSRNDSNDAATVKCGPAANGANPNGNAAGGTLTNNGGNTGNPTPAKPQLRADVVCDPNPLVIRIFELPSRTCTIWIANWRRDTASPVQVILLDAVDQYSNHNNGIQVFGAMMPGSSQGVAPAGMSAYAGRSGAYGVEYPWHITVFACPSQRGTGANCYNFQTAPGPFTVRILVQQEGALSVRADLIGIALAPANTKGGGVATAAGAFTRIHNRWKADRFINIEAGFVQSSPVQGDWWSAMWTIEPVAGTPYYRIHNRWKTDQFLNVEGGQIQSTPIQDAWWSAMWTIEPVAGTPYFRIHNRWKTDQFLNVESGQLQSTPIQDGWWSAMWTLE